jgi:hypothetical protein
METETHAGLAEKFGRKVGALTLFFIYDKNVFYRWIKRILLAGLLLFCLLDSGFEFAKTLTTLAVLVFSGCALAMGGEAQGPEGTPRSDFSSHPSIPRDGPAGYGYYDDHGNFRGATDPGDTD